MCPFRHNYLRDEECSALGISLPKSLALLNLRGNMMGARGREALCDMFPRSTDLLKLEPSEKMIGDESCTSLCHVLPSALIELP